MSDPAFEPDLHGTDQPRPSPARTDQATKAARDFAIHVARLLADDRCDDVLLIDVRDLSELADFIVLGTGTSDRQIKAVADHVNELARDQGYERYGSEHDAASRWVVLDYIEVMVHLFDPETRAHYDLEMLWGDAPRVTWQRAP